jgi:hypothetical protein
MLPPEKSKYLRLDCSCRGRVPNSHQMSNVSCPRVKMASLNRRLDAAALLELEDRLTQLLSPTTDSSPKPGQTERETLRSGLLDFPHQQTISIKSRPVFATDLEAELHACFEEITALEKECADSVGAFNKSNCECLIDLHKRLLGLYVCALHTANHPSASQTARKRPHEFQIPFRIWSCCIEPMMTLLMEADLRSHQVCSTISEWLHLTEDADQFPRPGV